MGAKKITKIVSEIDAETEKLINLRKRYTVIFQELCLAKECVKKMQIIHWNNKNFGNTTDFENLYITTYQLYKSLVKDVSQISLKLNLQKKIVRERQRQLSYLIKSL